MTRRTLMRFMLAVLGGLSFADVFAPAAVDAVQARVSVSCPTAPTPNSGDLGTLGTLDGTSDINFGTAVTDGVYAVGSCRFKIIGTARFQADATKVGQLFLNNISIRNVGTADGTVSIVYRHLNRAADPRITQCTSLSADGFFYAGAALPSTDKFDLGMKVEYSKSGALRQRYVMGSGRETPTTAAPTNSACPSTAGFDTSLLDSAPAPARTLAVGTLWGAASGSTVPSLGYTVVTDPFFNPQNPVQVFNAIPACTDCTAGGTSTFTGARITKQFDVTLKVGHEISSLATIQAAMAEQAAKPNPGELARQQAANARLFELASAACAGMDLKPGESVNFMHFTGDQGHVIVDLHGSQCFDVTQVDPESLLLFVGQSGLDPDQACVTAGTCPVFHGGGAQIVSWQFNDYNGDGILDLRAKFRQSDLGVVPGDDRAMMTGTFTAPVEQGGSGLPATFTVEDSVVTK